MTLERRREKNIFFFFVGLSQIVVFPFSYDVLSFFWRKKEKQKIGGKGIKRDGGVAKQVC